MEVKYYLPSGQIHAVVISDNGQVMVAKEWHDEHDPPAHLLVYNSEGFENSFRLESKWQSPLALSPDGSLAILGETSRRSDFTQAESDPSVYILDLKNEFSTRQRIRLDRFKE